MPSRKSAACSEVGCKEEVSVKVIEKKSVPPLSCRSAALGAHPAGIGVSGAAGEILVG